MNDDTLKTETMTPSPEELYGLLVRCAHSLGRGHHRGMRFQPGQQRVLSLLAARDKIGQSELADLLQIRAASLSELLTKLEIKGLITRTRAEGTRRGVDVELTDLGEKAAGEFAGDGGTAQGIFSALSEEEQRQLAEILRKLLGAGCSRDCWDEGPGFHGREHGGHWDHHGDFTLRDFHGGHHHRGGEDEE